jgi:hypothetical protein
MNAVNIFLQEYGLNAFLKRMDVKKKNVWT